MNEPGNGLIEFSCNIKGQLGVTIVDSKRSKSSLEISFFCRSDCVEVGVRFRGEILTGELLGNPSKFWIALRQGSLSIGSESWCSNECFRVEKPFGDLQYFGFSCKEEQLAVKNIHVGGTICEIWASR